MKRSWKSRIISLVMALTMVFTYSVYDLYFGVENEAEAAAVCFKIGDTGYTSLEAAYNAAQNGDTIDMVANATLTNQIAWYKNVMVNGHGYTLKDAIAGKWAIYFGTPSLFRNMTIQCTVDKSGSFGGIAHVGYNVGSLAKSVADPIVVFNGVKFKDYTTSGYYIIYDLSGSGVGLLHCTFENCASYHYLNYGNIWRWRTEDQFTWGAAWNGSKHYMNGFRDAFAEAKSGDTIWLNRDCYGEDFTLPAGQTLTLDLHGYEFRGTITNNGTLIIKDSTGYGMLTKQITNNKGAKLTVEGGTIDNGGEVSVKNHGDVTLKGGKTYRIDSYSGGTVTVDGGAACTKSTGAALYLDGAKATVKSGQITSKGGGCISLVGQGSAEITGGKLSTSSGRVLHLSNAKTVKISGSTVVIGPSQVDKGTLSISGGYFSSKPSDSWVASGYIAVASKDTTKGTEYAVGKAVCAIGTAKYIKVADAISNAKSGDTIKLSVDITENIAVTAGKNLTLDLVGKKVKAASGNTAITNNGTLTIKDSGSKGEITGSVINSAGANITIKSGSLKGGTDAFVNSGTATIDGGNIYYVKNNSGASLTINGGTVKHGTDGVGITNFGTAVMNGGTVYRFDNDSSAAITLNGGKITNEDCGGQAALYVNNKSNLTINGGTIDGNSGVTAVAIYRSSNAAIKGGTIIGDKAVAITVNFEGTTAVKNSVVVSGDAIVKGKINNLVGTVKLDGGYYSEKPNESFAAEGKKPVIHVDSSKGVLYTVAVHNVSVGDKPYGTIAMALQQSNTGETIKLVKNVQENANISKGKDFTLDLNGYNLSASSGETALTVGGKLTLKDSMENGTITNQVKVESTGEMTVVSGRIIYPNKTGVANYGNVTVKGGEVQRLDCYSGGNATIEGGKLSANNTGAALYSNNKKSKLIIKGGTLDASAGSSAILLNGGTAEISAGTLIGGTSGAVRYMNANSKLTVNGAAILKGGIQMIDKAEIELSDGWYSEKVDEDWAADGMYPTNEDPAGPDGAKFTLGYVFTLDMNFEGNKANWYYFVARGSSVAEPSKPYREGYEFTGWYETPTGTKLYSFSEPITSGVTVYAHWKEVDPWVDNCNIKCSHQVKVGNRHYFTLKDAVENAPSGSTIIAIRDFETSVEIPADKSFKLDLNGHTISQIDSACAVICNKGTLTVTDSTYTKYGKITIPNQTGAAETIENYGTLNIEAGTIYNGNASSCTIANMGGKLNITGGIIKSPLSYAIFNGTYRNTAGTVTMSDGEIDAYLYCLWTTGDGASKITGGTLYSTKSYAIMTGYQKNDSTAVAGNLELSGGTVTSDAYSSDGACIYNYHGSVTILPNAADSTYPRLIGKTPIYSSDLSHTNTVQGGWYSSPLVKDDSTYIVAKNGNEASATGVIASAPEGTPYTVGYIVTYNMNYTGGVSKLAYAPVTTGTPQRIADPTRLGYVFEGWCRDTAGKSEIDVTNLSITSATTFYARWREGSQASIVGQKIVVNDKYYLTVKASTHGRISVDLLGGDAVKVTLLPDGGYQVGSIFMDGNYAGDGYKTYKITLRGDTTIAATFLPSNLSEEEYRQAIEQQKLDQNGDPTLYENRTNDPLTKEKKPTTPDDRTVSGGGENTGGKTNKSDYQMDIGDGNNSKSSKVTNEYGEEYKPGSDYVKKEIESSLEYEKIKGGIDSQGWTYEGSIDIDSYIPSEETLYHVTIDRTQSTEDQVKQAKEILSLFKLTARSGYATSPKGKKAIKIIWFDKKYSMDVFDGVEVYRSTQKNKGYGKKPKFETVLGRYYNTAIKKGTRYYYKMRGYIEIEGVRYYTDWSIKAIRKAK